MPRIIADFNTATGNSWQAGTPNAQGQIDSLRLSGSSPWIDVVHGGDNANQWLVENTPARGASLPAGWSSLSGGNAYTAPYLPFAQTPALQLPGASLGSLLR
jgi:hypothetical protein